jgi:hypothetical protein
VDTRPEIGSYAGTSIYVDTNGNFYFDPENADTHNEDIAYVLGITSDRVFAGNFSSGPNADGFDKIAAYGEINGAWRWLIDTNSNGMPDLNVIDPRGIAGLPVAGNFDGNAANGDEVGVYNGSEWWLDTDHDFKVDTRRPAFVQGGIPLVGDFDGDGLDDLAVWCDDHFYFNLTTGVNGDTSPSFRFGFAGTREIPVAADMNQDGYADLGLWAPDQAGTTPGEGAEWYFLVSETDQNGAPQSLLNRLEWDPTLRDTVVNFHPEPFGGDFLAQFGDEYALPLVGNFDPPVTAPGAASPPDALHQNFGNPYDVDGNGQVTRYDVLALANDLRAHGRRDLEADWNTTVAAPYLDVDGDQEVSPYDVLRLANYLRQQDRLRDHAQRTVEAAPAAAPPAAAYVPIAAGAALSSPAASTPPESQAEPFWFSSDEYVSSSAPTTATGGDAAPADITAESADQIFAEETDAQDSFADDGANDEFASLLDDIADDVSAAWHEDEEDPLDITWS